jgi:hypothetical protein
MSGPACACLFQPQHHYSSPDRKTARRGEGNISAPLRCRICRYRPPVAPLGGGLAARRLPSGCRCSAMPQHGAVCGRRLPLSRSARGRGACSRPSAVGRLSAGVSWSGRCRHGPSRRLCGQNGSASEDGRRWLDDCAACGRIVSGPRAMVRPAWTGSAGPASVRPGARPGRSGPQPRPGRSPRRPGWPQRTSRSVMTRFCFPASRPRGRQLRPSRLVAPDQTSSSPCRSPGRPPHEVSAPLARPTANPAGRWGALAAAVGWPAAPGRLRT